MYVRVCVCVCVCVCVHECVCLFAKINPTKAKIRSGGSELGSFYCILKTVSARAYLSLFMCLRVCVRVCMRACLFVFSTKSTTRGFYMLFRILRA